MAKSKRPVSLSFVLLRFAVVTLVCMGITVLAWWSCMMWLFNIGFAFPASTASQQVAALLENDEDTLVLPPDFLAEYALFDKDGILLQTNTGGKALQSMADILAGDIDGLYNARKSYSDGSTAVFRWHYRSEYADTGLRALLPPFEYVWLVVLAIPLILCLLLNTLWLRRQLVGKLKLFRDVSARVGAQELDFTVPRAGIREFDDALGAMEDMRAALYQSLSASWAAQQAREAEIAALAHDLKTPLTLVGGNAELLLEEPLSDENRKMVETIAASSQRAKQYVSDLLDASTGTDEAFENGSLPALFGGLCEIAAPIAEKKGVKLRTHNALAGNARIQRGHLLRALGNVVQNAIEQTPAGKTVAIEGETTKTGFTITVRDEGAGFSQAALRHATERLWRDDTSRNAKGHNGLGLWFAAKVAEAHGAKLILANNQTGGVVVFECLFTDKG